MVFTMAPVLFFTGIGSCLAAVVTALISLSVDNRGLSEVNPLGSLALAVAAIACFKGFEMVRAHEQRVIEAAKTKRSGAV